MATARVIDALQALVPPADDCSDGELLERFAADRDGPAFAELVRRHGPMVYGVCRRALGNGPDADDAFQATFFVLARKAASVRSLGSWLYGVARKVSIRARSQAIQRRVRQMAAAKPEAVHTATPTGDLWAVLDEELGRLPEHLRQAILACDVGGQSRSRAARELGWPEGTVAKRLAKAREELARRLTRRGVTLSLAGLSATLAEDALAVVPARLVAETAARGSAFAAGNGTPSLAAQSLAEGVMRSMNGNVLKMWAATGLVAVVLAGGGFMLANGPTEPPPKKDDPPRGAEPVAKAADPVQDLDPKWRPSGKIETPGWLPASVAWTADGTTLVLGGSSGHVWAIDAATLKERWKAKVDGQFAAVAMSANQKTVYATFKDGVRFIDLATGKLGAAIEEKGSEPTALATFADRVQIGGSEKPVFQESQVVFGNPRGYFVKTWIEPDKVSTIASSTVPAGKEPADPFAIPLAADPMRRFVILTGPIDRTTGKNVLWAWVAGNYDKDSPGNRLMSGHEAIVVSAAISLNGKLAMTGDASGRVILWDTKDMKETRRFEFGGRVTALAVSNDGKQLAAHVLGKQAEVFAWSAHSTDRPTKPIAPRNSNLLAKMRASLSFSPDGRRLALAAFDAMELLFDRIPAGTVQIFETTKSAIAPPNDLNWKLEPSIVDPEFDIHSLSIAPDGGQFAVSFGGKTAVYDTASAKRNFEVKGPHARFAGKGLFIWSESAVEYDATSGKTIKAHPKGVFKFGWHFGVISPDGTRVAGFDGTEVQLRDVATGFEPLRLAGQGASPEWRSGYPHSGVAWSPDGKFVAGFHPNGEFGRAGGLSVWNAKTGERVGTIEQTLTSFNARSACFAFSPDGKTIAVGGLTADNQKNSTLTVFDATTLKKLREIPIRSRDGGADVTAVAFSPDGSTVIAAVNNHSGKGPLVRIHAWETTGTEISHTYLPDHDSAPISALAFTPDGRTLIATTGTVPVERQQGKEVAHRIFIWRGTPK